MQATTNPEDQIAAKFTAGDLVIMKEPMDVRVVGRIKSATHNMEWGPRGDWGYDILFGDHHREVVLQHRLERPPIGSKCGSHVGREGRLLPSQPESDPSLGERLTPRSGESILDASTRAVEEMVKEKRSPRGLVMTAQSMAEGFTNATASLSDQPLTAMGRSQLLVQISTLTAENKRLLEERDADRRYAAVARDSLKDVQTECSRLKNTDRVAGFLRDKPQLMGDLLDLAWAIDAARKKHPEGSSLLAIISETGELADATRLPNDAREKQVREEAIDVAVTAMRVAMGEVNREETWHR